MQRRAARGLGGSLQGLLKAERAIRLHLIWDVERLQFWIF